MTYSHAVTKEFLVEHGRASGRRSSYFRYAKPRIPDWLHRTFGLPISPGLIGLWLLAQLFIFLYFPDYLSLTYLFLTMILGNCFLSVPHEPFLLYYGAGWNPILVAFISSTAAFTACFVDYWAVRSLFSLQRLKLIKESRTYVTVVAYFLRAPDIIVLVSAVTQLIPFTVVRVLGPTSSYPVWRYATFVFLGRVVRFYVFVHFASDLDLKSVVLLLAAIALTTYSSSLTLL